MNTYNGWRRLLLFYSVCSGRMDIMPYGVVLVCCSQVVGKAHTRVFPPCIRILPSTSNALGGDGSTPLLPRRHNLRKQTVAILVNVSETAATGGASLGGRNESLGLLEDLGKAVAEGAEADEELDEISTEFVDLKVELSTPKWVHRSFLFRGGTSLNDSEVVVPFRSPGQHFVVNEAKYQQNSYSSRETRCWHRGDLGKCPAMWG